ncbi:hypothetical protein THASP1DRAFT_29666 [Thamnocephalis sphaerospora]|uniref:Uncharacterized protein n=1 Tax=Thamnocephalis sphaerospora TaxID=78915 RepID=A0A4P9XR32_9FUNG|nr:hypothetical protein THASP1DRAFT_29666 [Thamnocephalis sphaerospora]|eukprot:RKP08533.1 hypothetical protein THASP1DRAFT_29666 [Thamnocephalis sphaerospora]
MGPGSIVWIRELTGGVARELAQDVHVIHQHDRWALALPLDDGEFDPNESHGWSLLDMKGEFPPCNLALLNSFDYGEYTVSQTQPIFDFDECLFDEFSPIISTNTAGEVFLSRDYQNAFIMAASDRCVTIYAFNASRTGLYWKAAEVTFDYHTNAGLPCCARELSGDTMHGHARTLRTVYIDAWRNCNVMIRSFKTQMLSGDRICVSLFNAGNDVATCVLDARSITSTTLLSEANTSMSAEGTLCAFPHGWLDSAGQYVLMQLPHRKLLLMAVFHKRELRDGKSLAYLRRLHDGTIVTTYSLPAIDKIVPVVGDLALISARLDDTFHLKLFDMFAGITVRIICDTCDMYINTYTVTPAYLLRDRKEEAQLVDGEASLLTQGEEQQSAQQIYWLDFMPNV